MKIKTNKKHFFTLPIICLVVTTLILAGLATYIYGFKGKIFGWSPITSSDNAINYNPPTQEEVDAGKDVKEDTINPNEDSSPKNDQNETTPSPTPTPDDQPNNIGLNITAASQNGSTLQIRALIAAVTSKGTCKLTLSKTGAASVVKTADIQALANSSTCKGFDVSTSELPAGTWTATLVYEDGSNRGTATKEVIVK